VARERDREAVAVAELRGLAFEGRRQVDEAEPARSLHRDDRRRGVGQ
jgi:hypothetical protein